MLRRDLLTGLLAALTVPAKEAVDVALVLVGDVSRSIDEGQYKLPKDGYAAVLTDPRVLAAITGGQFQAVAIAYVAFAGAAEVRTVLDWAVPRDAATVRDHLDCPPILGMLDP
jgi:hypothetical protein